VNTYWWLKRVAVQKPARIADQLITVKDQIEITIKVSKTYFLP
jgi:hypothetical protein